MDQAPPQDLPQDNKLALRRVVRACRKAVLSTLLAEDGAPYGSLVTVALDHDLSPILLLSALSDHSRNIAADARVSLLFDGTDGHPNPQTGPRLTLMGRVEKTSDPRLRARFLARHPGAALYADFADFSFWRVVADRAHFVGGFGRAVWLPAPFGIDPAVAAAFAAAPEPDGVAGWDLDGVDVIRDDVSARISFDPPVDGPASAHKAWENLQFQGQE
ncbi:MAG: Heme iron utilization [Rhodospirillaceae bacterium]|nr:MAG: Heme iron utilization [Rhodospirillaceae bacterium]TNC95305.1 MAG: Heme iron utilization protein [Stygiobacter sp.]